MQLNKQAATKLIAKPFAMNVKHILLIDDDEVTNYINTRFLKAALPDAEIVVAMNGLEAIRLINERTGTNNPLFDTIMVDISMPYMDGWEFIETLSGDPYKAYHQANLVMLTSSVFEDDIKRARSYKIIKSFLSKPLDTEKVAGILNYDADQQKRF